VLARNKKRIVNHPTIISAKSSPKSLMIVPKKKKQQQYKKEEEEEEEREKEGGKKKKREKESVASPFNPKVNLFRPFQELYKGIARSCEFSSGCNAWHALFKKKEKKKKEALRCSTNVYNGNIFSYRRVVALM